MSKKDIQKLINKLDTAEQHFLNSEFLSPVIQGVSVRVRISGIVMSMRLNPLNFHGWGIFKPVSRHLAQYIRNPTMMEKKQYLSLFPTLRFVLNRQDGNTWFGNPATQSDTRFKITGSVPIQLAEEVQVFDIVCTRFDSSFCWFDEIDPSRNPKNFNYLRGALQELLEPDKLKISGLTKEEIDAYHIAYHLAYENSEEAKKGSESDRIKTALTRAGADYKGHIDRGDTYTIEYAVDGHQHRSVVTKDNLSVVSAGICLSGGDRNFDLQSLVCVVRTGHNKGHVVNTEGRNWNEYGYNDNEDDYD